MSRAPYSQAPRWITNSAPASKRDFRALYLRGQLDLDDEIVSARARVSSLGWNRFFVNGIDLTGPALVPRWTPFDHYVEFQEYDLTAVLRQGPNILGMAVGDGRFRGRNGALNSQAVYGDRLAGYAHIEVEFASGRSASITTDETWWAGTGRIGATDPKFGEQADLRIGDTEWLTDVRPPNRFAPAQILDTTRTLIAEEVGRVRQVDTLAPLSITRTRSGKQLVDFGQNAAGVVRLRLAGTAGTAVRLTHSEIVGADGEIDTRYISVGKKWTQTDQVILDGVPTWWQPWFTIHGFRYVEVDGLPNDLSTDEIEFVVISSDLPMTGSFECSDPRLTKLHQNVGWTMRSNFTDTPTDCPTRERSGWTGDIQVFAPTATTYADVDAYLRRYLRNLATEQLPSGRVPSFIPSETAAFSGGMPALLQYTANSTGWGDASVLVPWTLYQYYGDIGSLELGYPAARRWVDQMIRRAAEKSNFRRRGRRGTGNPELERHILDTGFHFGEWLRAGEGPIATILDTIRRSGAVVATAYLEHSARMLSQTAQLLGHREDAAHYQAHADRTREAWRAAFLHADGRIGFDRQDDYVRAIAFDLLDEQEKPPAVTRLVELIARAGDHLGTGFLSTPFLLPVLLDNGRADVAFRLLLQTSSPSWLHQVECGATTVWETWEGYTDKGAAKYSHNHYAFGTVAGFLVERVAGIAPAEPGFRVIDVRPAIAGGITHASATVGTPFGPTSVAWAVHGDEVEVSVTVPAGATARFRLGAVEEILDSGDHTLRVPTPTTHVALPVGGGR